MHEAELAAWGLLLGVGGLIVLAYVTSVPYPILLVVGAAAIGFVPGAPEVELEPELVLVVLLPPLLYSAAFFSSLRDLQANVRPISLLSVGCVLATMGGVAVIGHVVVGLDWAVAFTLGAIVAPTDAVAATAIASRVGAPRRFVTIIEGESLINDSTALIAYAFAVDAALSGSFSAPEAVGRFVLNAAAGVAIGLAVGWGVARVRRRIEDSQTEGVLSLATAYVAYLPAEALGVSAVLAAVTTGIFLGWRSPRLTTPSTRLQLYGMWSVVQFALNALVFTLVGLELPNVIDGISGEPAATLAGWGAAIALAVIVVRFLWVFPATYLPRRLSARIRERDPTPPVANVVLVSWSGLRGAVSLAAALALPIGFGDGGDRDLLIFLTYATILSTLVLQGLSLPWLIRLLGVTSDEETIRRRESKARLLAAEAALRRLDELGQEDWVRDDTADRMRKLFEFRRRRFAARFADDGSESDGIESRSADYQRLMREMLEAQRDAVVDLRNRGRIDDEVMHRIERDLDLEDTRLEV